MKKWLVVMLLLAVAAPLAAARPLMFSAIPGKDEADLRRRFEPVAAYLAKALDVEVQYVPTSSYGKSLGAFKDGKVDLAWLGGFSGVRGRFSVPGAKPIIQAKEDTAYTSCFIARRSVGVSGGSRFPYAIAGKSFVFGPQPSTSGRLMPEFFIRRHLKKSPGKLFTRVGYAKNHQDTIALVQSGKFQAGSLACSVWRNEIAAGNVSLATVFLIWETPGYHDYNFSVQPRLDEIWGRGFTRRLTQAMLDMTDPKLLAAFPRSGWVRTQESNFDIIREAARAAGLGEYE